MDNLTHTLTGVLLARAGLSRLSPRATWIAALAANAPDLDGITMLAGAETYFVYHRWATHAIVFAPVVAAVVVGVVAAVTRQRLPWFRSWLVALIAVASHLLLDFTNPYGIRLLLPFSDAWPALSITHVIDVWIWAILLFGALWPMLSKLVSSEIGAKSHTGRGMALGALSVLVIYDSARYLLHARAVETLVSRVYGGAVPRHVEAFPQPFHPLHWNGWVETEQSWLATEIDLAEEFDAKAQAVYSKAQPHPAFEAARELRGFQVLSAFARTPLWRISPVDEPAGASRVELVDLRFGRNGRPGFRATAVVDANGRVIESDFLF